MTFVTLERSRSWGSNMVFTTTWCFCVTNSVRVRQIFLEILCGNHISNPVALNDICDLGNEVKVAWFELGRGLPWSLYLVKICQIILQILGENHLSYPVDLNDFETLKIRSRLPGSNLILVLSWCFLDPSLVRIIQTFLEILSATMFHMPSPQITSVTLKMRSTLISSTWSSSCPGASVYQIWCGYIKFFL